ncbi:3-deoxy-D-manno-octulosonic acid transferase [Tropicibacter naphthalenivorans]|uniref:3-deoxy-D-manno-octulosonic acid transferase n=1 Tax=Tropicibacter naphthalenivorans TaxID=441103 RepID=A0A0P1G1N0_9RHOB|nr:glycosyltransferase N-terminal domain-containing protein [Tropicibacter naphthalenivorans]CUH75464.1 3-deoxy-D-manno-octulosonic acid transferase [Tropicibacter naphthalenivorans]SMC44338.1 3-deoxy-D-manno-octulosonic-acid transferase [Tropicibacter naphthalenivorans]
MAPRTLSLTAYMAFARGTPGSGNAAPLPDRPGGPLVWAHAAGVEQGRSLASLCARMGQMRPELNFALSGDTPAQPGALSVTLPPESPAECERWLAALRPDVLLWNAHDLRPALLAAAHKAGVRLIAIDVTDSGWTSPAPRWLPDPAAATLALFDSLYATGTTVVGRLRRMGLDPDRIHKGAPLLDIAQPLPCDDATHEELVTLLSGRPVWLAARLHAAEVEDILRAHRRAVRLAHRLLLVIVPQDEDEAGAIIEAAGAAQMRVCNWDQGDTPDENTQIVLVEGPEELGLWYRIAPLVFIGGSLVTGTGGHDPYEAAALGSAILYGPNVGRYLGAYSRLVEAGAARIVRDADSLAGAVSNLVAPDQAASMAHAGWDVISSGAKTVDKVITDVFETLDEKATA